MKFTEKQKVRKFWSKVVFTESCWLWMGTIQEFGYGRITNLNGKNYLAHRVSWVFNRGPISKGLFVLHECDVPACVNPEHLFLGTQADNIKDMVSKGRLKTVRGSKVGTSKLSESDVKDIKYSGSPVRELASKYGITEWTVYDIRSERSWRHV